MDKLKETNRLLRAVELDCLLGLFGFIFISSAVHFSVIRPIVNIVAILISATLRVFFFTLYFPTVLTARSVE